MQNVYSENKSEETINLKQILFGYIRHWKWFVLSVFIGLILAKIYLRYAVPQYKATTTLLIKDEKSGGLSSELSAFKDLDILGGGSKNIDDEIEVLRSRTLQEKTIKTGMFHLSYISEGRIKSSEAYKTNLIKIHLNPKDSLLWNRDTIIGVQVISKSKFEIFDQEKNSLGIHAFGDKIVSNNLGTYSIERNRPLDKRGAFLPFKPTFYKIQIDDINKLTESMTKRITVNPLSKKTNVLELSLIDPVAERAKDYLNTLVLLYNQDAIKDKNQISQKTATFINDRLAIITQELDGVEKRVESYKESKKIVDIPVEAELNLRTEQQSNVSQVASVAKLKVVDMMLQHIRTSGSYDLLPVNIIPNETQSAGFINEYNNLIVERNKILQSSTDNNPTVLRFNERINALKGTIKESLVRLKSSLSLELNQQNQFSDKIKSKIAQLPQVEREFRNIFRQQQIKEELYLYLFKKREETAIALAGTAPISKVIDEGFASHIPVSPKKVLIYAMAFIISLLLPFLIIYVYQLLDSKVKTKEHITKLGIPYLGDVPHSDSNDQVIELNSRTSSAEAIRIVRTNLEFVLTGIQEGLAKTIFVTSTIPGEGKSFIAANLATTIAISGKKVLLIGLDVRNPKVDEYFDVPHRGVTNYLSNPNQNIGDYILSQKGYEHFDILPSGIIPPNPAELLMNMKLDFMFDELKKQYDYIVVDTAPVSLVTDTILIAKNADAFVYVVRSNYLDKELLTFPESLYQEKKLPNMAMVLNDTSIEKGYGYGYGYGQQVKRKTWFERIKDRLPF